MSVITNSLWGYRPNKRNLVVPFVNVKNRCNWKYFPLLLLSAKSKCGLVIGSIWNSNRIIIFNLILIKYLQKFIESDKRSVNLLNIQ